MIKNYYKILGVGKWSSDEEIKAAYRALALQYHPDKDASPDAHSRFVEINEAYQVISNPQKRVRYNYLYDTYILNISVRTQQQNSRVGRESTTGGSKRTQPGAPYRYADRPGPPRYAPAQAASTLPDWMRMLHEDLPYTAPAWLKKVLSAYFIIVLIVVATFGIDYFLPMQEHEAPLKPYYEKLGVRYKVESMDSFNDAGFYYINTQAGELKMDTPKSLADSILLKETRLWGIDREVKVFYKESAATVKLGSVYERESLFWLLLLIFTIATGLYFKNSDIRMIKAALWSILLLCYIGLIFIIT
jgi:curved DNA-binding protein CbpA